MGCGLRAARLKRGTVARAHVSDAVRVHVAALAREGRQELSELLLDLPAANKGGAIEIKNTLVSPPFRDVNKFFNNADLVSSSVAGEPSLEVALVRLQVHLRNKHLIHV